MELKILESSKNKILAEVIGEDHSFCNILTKKLNEYENVKYAAYMIDHPLVGIPQIVVEGKDVKALLKKAVTELSAQAEELKKLSAKL